jgi:hypothetical protein
VYYLGHFANDNAWSDYVVVGDLQNPSSIQVPTGGEQPGGGGSEGGSAQPQAEVRYPSGAVFAAITQPQDGIDYSDPVAHGIVPLIDTRSRETERVSANFQLNEFMARGARYARLAPSLVEALQAVRSRLNQPLKIDSAYRHPALNQSLNGDPQSEHLSGRAATLRGTSASLRPLDIARAALEAVSEDFAPGLGPSSVHVELAGSFSTFVYSGASMSDEEFAAWAHGIRNQSRSVRRATESLELVERSRPTIDGPQSVARAGSAPVFRIAAGINRYFAVEITAQPRLFRADASESRRSDQFYGSWHDPAAGLMEIPASGVAIFVLPDEVWTRLRHHAVLYYRVLTTSERSAAWPDLLASTPDDRAEEAPRLRVADRRSPRLGRFGGESTEPTFLKSHALDDRQWNDE